MLDSRSEAGRRADALHRVLVKARHLALQEGASKKLVDILDWAELLARDISVAEPGVQEFEEHLAGLGEDHPEYAGISRDYSSNP